MEGSNGKSRTRTPVKGKKKRGREEAATRANRFREAEGYTRRGKETMDDGENSRKVKGAGPNKNKIKLSFTKTIGIMDKRKQQYADVSQAAVNEGAEEEEER